MSDAFIFIILAGFATAAVSVTLAKSELLKKWRDWVCNKSEILGELVTCPYCVSHYVAIVFTLIIPVDLVTNSLGNFVLVWCAVVGINALIAGQILRAYRTPD